MNFEALSTIRRAVALRLFAVPCTALLVGMTVAPRELRADLLSSSIVESIAAALFTSANRVADFSSVMLLLVNGLIAYLLGWVAVAAYLVVAGRYTGAQVRRIFVSSEVPPNWQHEAAHERMLQSERHADELRAHARRLGALQFILLRGGIFFGSSTFLLLHVAHNLFKAEPIVWQALPLRWALWVAFGMLLAAGRWLALFWKVETDA